MNYLIESQGPYGVGVWFIMFTASASREDTPPAVPGYNHAGYGVDSTSKVKAREAYMPGQIIDLAQ
jgi:hypothetical protein